MSNLIIENQRFEKHNFELQALPKGEYERCTFVNCNFSNTNISGYIFLECEFIGCNTSTANITKTAFRDCVFKDCKLLGMHFQNCHEFLFAINFYNCQLNLSSFYKLKLKKGIFENCILKEVDFESCDLTSASFAHCDLLDAKFDNTNLELADFTTAFNYILNPESNKMKKAKFSLDGLPGLLTKYQIVVS